MAKVTKHSIHSRKSDRFPITELLFRKSKQGSSNDSSTPYSSSSPSRSTCVTVTTCIFHHHLMTCSNFDLHHRTKFPLLFQALLIELNLASLISCRTRCRTNMHVASKIISIDICVEIMSIDQVGQIHVT